MAVEAVEEAFEDMDMHGAAFQGEDLAYWEEIIGLSRRRGHSVVYLDSLQLHIEAAKKRESAVEMERILMGLSEYSVVEGKERDIEEIRFALQAVSDFVFNVRREDVIFERLMVARPNLAVIGAAHGDQLMLTPNLPTELGVTEYWHGVVPDPSTPSIFSTDRLGYVPTRQYLEPGVPDRAFVAQREQTTRSFRAATLGRISLGPDPALIGSWEVTCRPFGLFEVHVARRSGDKIEGTIIDTLGDSLFTGHVTDSELRLVKEYDQRKALTDNYITGRIVHEAEADADGVYRGIWRSEEQPRLAGELVVVHGHELYTPPPISTQLQLF